MTTRKERDKVTVEDLRAIREGDMVVFALPSARAVNTGKSLAYFVARELNCRFVAKSDYEKYQLTLTKKAR